MLRRAIQQPATTFIVPSVLLVGFLLIARWALGVPLF